MQNEISTPYFNSIKVRLEPNSFAIKVGIDPFQFHKGTIRTACREVAPKGHFNFNSIKVRLERLRGLPTAPILGFQFHKGTIRTPYRCESRPLVFLISIP